MIILHLLQGEAELPREERKKERRIKPHLSLILQEYIPDSLGCSCQESSTAGIFFMVDLSFNLFSHFFTNVRCAAYNNCNETTQHLSVYCYYISLANHNKPRTLQPTNRISRKPRKRAGNPVSQELYLRLKSARLIV